jgi:enterochelin esterase-like enzyme
VTDRRAAFGLRWLSGLLAGVLLVALAACRAPGRLPWELVPIPPAGIEQSRTADGPVIHIDRVRFLSASLGDDRYFLALVPNGPEPVTRIMVINHGWLDRAEYLLEHLAIDRVYADLLSKKTVERAVVVLPDLRILGRFGGNRPRPPRSAVTTYVAEDVAALAARRYGIPADRSRWSVSGFSFGGFVALDVGRTFGDRFGGVGVVSAFYDSAWTFWQTPGASTGLGGNAQSASSPGPPPRLLLACGTDDRFFKDMQSLHRRFASSDIQHEWLTSKGGHTWEYWATVVEPLLTFHLGRVEQAGSQIR